MNTSAVFKSREPLYTLEEAAIIARGLMRDKRYSQARACQAVADTFGLYAPDIAATIAGEPLPSALMTSSLEPWSPSVS